MKKIILIIIVLFFSCIPYDGETIISINFKLINSNNEPIVNGYVYLEDDFYGDFQNSVYKSSSNNEGIVQFNMFKAKTSTSLIINESLTYLPVKFSDINKHISNDYNLNLGEIVLLKNDEITNFSIYTNQSSANKVLQKIEIEAIEYKYDINPNPNDIVNINPYYKLKKNQNFELQYELKNTDTNVIESFTIPLFIADQPLTYTITY